jgi:uncharacterized protein with HEPN domain
MSKREISLLIDDMFQCCLKIKKYADGSDFDSFINDDKTIDAIVRNIEVIGEASTQISPDFKLNYPFVEWNELKGIRNRIVHEYFGIDYEVIWNIIDEEIDVLIKNLEIIKNDLSN